VIGSGTSGTVVVNNPQTIIAVAGGTTYDDSPTIMQHIHLELQLHRPV
jgi:hypothetical protein